jgi:hypothetical protein
MLFNRDRKRHRQYDSVGKRTGIVVTTLPRSAYKQKIHQAVLANGPLDPFTGETLAWNLVHEWDPVKAKGDFSYARRFFLLPTVDHVDPYSDALEFEICSWLVNTCKSDLTPPAFVGLCKKIVAHRGASMQGRTPEEVYGDPAKYFLPLFLAGICGQDVYRRWLAKRALQLFTRDRKQNRLCALAASTSMYKQKIHEAVLAAGLLDPFTGDALAWDKIGTWNDARARDRSGYFKKQFDLLPTVDHVDPAAASLMFEICSWLVNDCKAGLSPAEFFALCQKVACKSRA